MNEPTLPILSFALRVHAAGSPITIYVGVYRHRGEGVDPVETFQFSTEEWTPQQIAELLTPHLEECVSAAWEHQLWLETPRPR